MSLSAIAIRNAKPKHKPYKLADEKGLYLLIRGTSKYWRFDYRFGGKRKTLALGIYPDVTLAKAREDRDKAREKIANEIDPSTTLSKQAIRQARQAAAANSFEAVTREWFDKHSPAWTPGHAEKVIRRLQNNVFSWIGNRAIAEINAPELLTILRRVEARGAIETAHRVQQYCGQIFRYAIATGRAERNPAADLRGALPPVVEKHRASIIDPKEIGSLLRTIEGYKGSFITKCALKIAPLTFVRPGELRHAEWKEFNFDKAEWRIPAEKMKMRAAHIVPLSKQAIAIFHELRPLTGNGRYIFPSARTSNRPMSENTVLGALRRLGYAKDEMTGHGFRSMASTLLNEQGWHRDAIERQLAHAERDTVRAAYNFAEHLPERRKMMQHWADYLDELARGGKVIAGNFR